MGAGRRTETLLGTHPPTLSPNSVANTAYFLHLTPQNLASVVFGCKYATFKECMEKLIFGLPYHHISYVEKVQPGMPLFLFNYSDRKMHGVFEAVSRGELNINPNGWTTNGSGKTPYPAQVQVRVRQLYQPLPENVFKDAIVENYYTDSHFYFELDHTQTNKLLSLFTRNSYKAPGSIVIKPEAVTLNKDNSAISQHQEENDDGWIKPKKTAKSVLDAWHKAAPFIPLTQKSLFAQSEAREAMPEHWDDFVGSDAQPKAREATPEHWDDFFGSDVDSKVENNLSVAGPTDFSCYEWEAADSEKKESPLEKSSDNRVRSSNGLSLNPAVLSYAEKENKEPKRPEWKHKVFQKQKQQPTEKPEATADVLLPEAGIPLHVEKDIEEHKKAQHELEVLGKLKQLQKLKAQSNSQENVDVPAGQNSVHEKVDAAAIPNNHISEWEKLARQRCLQEQTMLREEHEKLRGSLQAIDSSVAKVIQKNLELSAVAIAQMTQDRLELKRVLEEASMELGLLKEVDQLRKRNAVLELTQDQMASDLESLKCDMVRMSAQLDVLMKGGISVSKTMSIGSIFGEKKLESQVDSHKVYLLGGHNGESWLGSVDVFIPATYEVMPVAPMLSPRSYAAATVLLGQIYVFGGGNGKLWYETAETYDSERNEWFSCSPMSIKRGSLAGAALGDRVFALGGGNGQVNFSDVECYDPQLGMWIASTSMLYKRFGVAAAELEGALYAIGGYDGWQYLRSVERFDPREALWTSVSSMNRKRGSLSAAALGGKIYAVGGYDGAEFLSSVEFYEPRTNCWVEMETGMHLKRAYGSAAIVGNSLYMFGGFSGGAYIDMVERYRANIGWEIAESAVVGRRSFLAGAVLQ